MNVLKVFGGQGMHDGAANAAASTFGSAPVTRAAMRLAEARCSGTISPCSIICAPSSAYTRAVIGTGYRIWDGPTLRKLQNMVLDEVVPNASENDRFHLRRAGHNEWLNEESSQINLGDPSPDQSSASEE